ncbi:MAG: hypothetical protein LBQ28_04635 [Prevotellaceae bacterium]|jgi:hypothetical protein|nr:hypothetical protein [Prevotellaceae bacterium]
MIFDSLNWPEGKVNPSGIKRIGYWIPKSHIAAFPTIQNEDAVTITAAVNYAGDFVLKEDKHWFSVYTTQGKGKATFEGIGEKDCKMFNNKCTLSYPDITDEAKNLVKATINASCIFIIPLPLNRFVVIGSDDYDVEATITGDTGDAPGSAKGITIEITAPDVTPLPGYKGELLLADGSLDCETGVFTPTDDDGGI